MIRKIIFIKEEKSLIAEINPQREMLNFLNLLLFHMTLDMDTNEMPIRITIDNKQRVENFLKKNYANEKRVLGLVSFLNDITIGKYLYIYLYDEKYVEIYDTLQESLKLYNKGLTHEEIILYMKEYVEYKKVIQNFLKISPYNISMLIPEKKIVKGEPDKNKRICIYCEGNVQKGIANFREVAHAIPEAIGNKKFIQNEECDECNDFFARQVEEDLCNWLMMPRLKYGIKGKNGYPVFQFKDQYARFIDAHTEDFEKPWGYFEAVKPLIKQRKHRGPIMVGCNHNNIEDKIEVSYIKDYKPMHVYKALVKCVIGLIEKRYLCYFRETINWLRYETKFIDLPKVAVVTSKKVVMEPELYIFLRKDENEFSIPYCYGELRVADTIIVYIIPFSSNDHKKFVNNEEFIEFTRRILFQYEGYELQDFSSIDKIPIDYSLDIATRII